jgi:hypothetical protein
MRLNPDLALLERIGITHPIYEYSKPGGYQMELMEKDFESLSPFLIQRGAGEALQELFFYQLNFVPICQPPKPQTLRTIQEDRTYFQSREKLFKMDFSQLKGIKLHFGKDENADLPPDLVKYFGQWIQKELESEKTAETTPAEKLQELKGIDRQLIDSKLKIQKALSRVEAILKAKSPEATFDLKQVILSTYAIFYQRGHQLDFRVETDPEETNPNFPDSFNHIRVYDILRRE